MGIATQDLVLVRPDIERNDICTALLRSRRLKAFAACVWITGN